MSPLFSAALGLPPQRGDGWHKTSRNRNRKGQGGGVKMWLVVWNIFYLGFNNDMPTISILFQYYIYIYHTYIISTAGWWFGCHQFIIFPEILGMECHHPN